MQNIYLSIIYIYIHLFLYIYTRMRVVTQLDTYEHIYGELPRYLIQYS